VLFSEQMTTFNLGDKHLFSEQMTPLHGMQATRVRPSNAWGPRRGWRVAELGQRRRDWAQRWVGRCAHGGGLGGSGRAHGVGFLQRTTDTAAGSRHTQPRGSQGAHAGEPGSKMRRILRPVQSAYFRRCHLFTKQMFITATSVAVRWRRLVSAHMHCAGVFHTKTLPVQGRSCA